jgi:hypothetical protein
MANLEVGDTHSLMGVSQWQGKVRLVDKVLDGRSMAREFGLSFLAVWYNGTNRIAGESEGGV